MDIKKWSSWSHVTCWKDFGVVSKQRNVVVFPSNSSKFQGLFFWEWQGLYGVRPWKTRDCGLDEIPIIKIERHPIICRERREDKTIKLKWQSPKHFANSLHVFVGIDVAVWFRKFTWWPLEVVLKLWFQTETYILWHLKKIEQHQSSAKTVCCPCSPGIFSVQKLWLFDNSQSSKSSISQFCLADFFLFAFV